MTEADDPHTGAALPRHEARTRALEALFAADVRDVPVDRVLEGAGWLDEFTERLLDTVAAHRDEIDALIRERARGWSLERMPVVDRNVLRLGLAELLYVEDVPPRVAIDEAVELVKTLSTDSSSSFVNGILAAVATDRGLL
ncbi:transcription antitermination factor NusB [Euzebya sp.]|uniref:transcription antitermination factor NusB n=1 Tax=Euzebya sp. TaxID=1971409 RepID=UPI003510EA03